MRDSPELPPPGWLGRLAPALWLGRLVGQAGPCLVVEPRTLRSNSALMLHSPASEPLPNAPSTCAVLPHPKSHLLQEALSFPLPAALSPSEPFRHFIRTSLLSPLSSTEDSKLVSRQAFPTDCRWPPVGKECGVAWRSAKQAVLMSQ